MIAEHKSDKSLEIGLHKIEEAIADIKEGKVVIVVDDEDRENEGDFICAAECVTPEIINFMATHGRGLICAPITEKRAKDLGLSRMVQENTDLHETAFTVSIDYKKAGCTTGISAYDRATGIKALVDDNTQPSDYARPGHIFPLIARQGGVLRRTGHTEATIDLAKLAGFKPAGVLIEILNEDGTMARLPQLIKIAERFDLKVISIKDLVAYRMHRDRLVERQDAMTLETQYGQFEVITFKEVNSTTTHLAIKKGDWNDDEAVLTRVHSATNAAEVMGFLLKNTNNELRNTMKALSHAEKGLILLLRRNEEEYNFQNIMQTLKEQEKHGKRLNPFSNRNMDSKQKEFGIGAQILHDLGIRKMKLMTNNPKRRIGLIGYGLEVVENVPI